MCTLYMFELALGALAGALMYPDQTCRRNIQYYTMETLLSTRLMYHHFLDAVHVILPKL